MTSLVLAASLFYPMGILLYIIFSFILIRQKQPAIVGGLFGLSPRWRYYFIRLIIQIPDTGPDLDRILVRIWGFVFEWRGSLFTVSLRFLQGILLHEGRGILNSLLPHPGDISILD